ncbi:MAG: endonuclease III [Bacteroidales bacterium]|nr:endonuclease III [Bacteroidales bacterium]
MGKIKDKYHFIIDYFSKVQPDVASELNYNSAYELLVATMLAAQCTDKRVNMVTPALFAAYPTVSDLAKATEEEILSYVKSVSYPNSKTRHLLQMAQMVVRDFGGIIPCNIDDLTKLPGVGRKTANVVLAFAYEQAAMPVDTHVFRVSHRLGLVADTAKTPEAVEKELVKHFPTEYISRAHHWLLLHGRYVCTARKPHCEKCALMRICDVKR